MSNPATKHPNFGEGNLVRLTHGVYSERRFHPIAEELTEALIADRPDLIDHLPAVAAWARSEARIMLAEDWVTTIP